jgi:2,3-bisphosphoglycerate-dependent phosphoglycerate mutase
VGSVDLMVANLSAYDSENLSAQRGFPPRPSIKPVPATLVLVRHGQSQWNLENRFTGWWDVNLSPEGEAEARHAGVALKEAGVAPDVAFTSVLTRAVRTLNLALEQLDRVWIPVERHWRLNERHYGGLTGLDKEETKAKHGEAQFKAWRRGYATPPPPLDADSPYDVTADPRYAAYGPGIVPATECLADVVARMTPYWYDRIAPQLVSGQTVIIAAHGNSLRALVKELEGISDDDITELEIPTGSPIIYTLDESLGIKDKTEL